MSTRFRSGDQAYTNAHGRKIVYNIKNVMKQLNKGVVEEFIYTKTSRPEDTIYKWEFAWCPASLFLTKREFEDTQP